LHLLYPCLVRVPFPLSLFISLLLALLEPLSMFFHFLTYLRIFYASFYNNYNNNAMEKLLTSREKGRSLSKLLLIQSEPILFLLPSLSLSLSHTQWQPVVAAAAVVLIVVVVVVALL